MQMNTELIGKLGIALLLGIPTLQGCKPDPGTDEAGTETTGDGDGDTGDGDGDTGDGDGDTGDGDGDGDGDAGDGDGDEPVTCPLFDPIAGAADGDPCTANTTCSSQVCEQFQSVPPVEGVCAPADTMCRTRIMGTVRDFTTREPAEGIDVKVAAALEAALGPTTADSHAEAAISDANGVIDVLSLGKLEAPLGIVGLGEGGDYYLTATGLAAPGDGISAYGPANTNHDIWVVPSAALTDWSGYLMGDAEIMDQLPLGEAGGIVGLVRDATTGEPIAGAVVVSVDGDTTGAKFRYLNEAGDGFTSDMTSAQGIFVVVSPGLGEEFDVEIGGESQGLANKAGSAPGAIFTLIMNIVP